VEQPETHPVKVNQTWVSDITYIHTLEGVMYLAVYIDIFIKKVVGFSMNANMQTDLLVNALEMALGRQPWTKGELTCHSDRGSQYASEQYRQLASDNGIKLSMSRKGNCYDNAFAESFFATLKKELIYRNTYKTREEARLAVFEYIEVWYNRKRIHSSIEYNSPVQFEETVAA
jgi:putative transposase